jgi:hypothetical protein
MVLILEHACRFTALRSLHEKPEALHKAYLQYKASETHSAVTEQFSAPPAQYSIVEFTEFILTHRLS